LCQTEKDLAPFDISVDDFSEVVEMQHDNVGADEEENFGSEYMDEDYGVGLPEGCYGILDNDSDGSVGENGVQSDNDQSGMEIEMDMSSEDEVQVIEMNEQWPQSSRILLVDHHEDIVQLSDSDSNNDSEDDVIILYSTTSAAGNSSNKRIRTTTFSSDMDAGDEDSNSEPPGIEEASLMDRLAQRSRAPQPT